MYYGESADCNIIMQPVIQCYLLSLQVHQNQQIVVLQPWLCGSVNHTGNRNKHHEEESRPLFCCSARLFQSMHWPGYVQGGQANVATCCQEFTIEEFLATHVHILCMLPGTLVHNFLENVYQFMLPETLVHNFSGTDLLVNVTKNPGAQPFKNILPINVARNPGAQFFKNILPMYVARNPSPQLFKNSIPMYCMLPGTRLLLNLPRKRFTSLYGQEP